MQNTVIVAHMSVADASTEVYLLREEHKNEKLRHS